MARIIRGVIVFSFFILALSYISEGIAGAAGEGAVKVMFLQGEPKINKVNTDAWAICRKDMVIDNGDKIKTERGEFVELSFSGDNSKIVRIGENSDTVIRKKEAPYSIELLRGHILAHIKNLPAGSTFEVRTPVGISGARGTGWESDTDGQRATFAAHEESIYARGIDQAGNAMEGELIVSEGWKTDVERFEKPSEIERLSAAEMDRWDGWKESIADRLPEQAAQAAAGAGAGQPTSGTPAATAVPAEQSPAETATAPGEQPPTEAVMEHGEQMNKVEQFEKMGGDSEKAVEKKSETVAENRIEERVVKEEERAEEPRGGGECSSVY